MQKIIQGSDLTLAANQGNGFMKMGNFSPNKCPFLSMLEGERLDHSPCPFLTVKST